MRALSFLLKLMIFVFLGVMSATLPSMILEQEDLWKEFEKHGVEVPGKVVEATYHSTCMREEPICVPVVEFTTQAGEKRRFSDYNTATYAGFPIGSSVRVLYLPHRSDSARIKTSTKSQAQYALKVRIVLWGLWAVCVFFLILFVKEYILDSLKNRGKEATENVEKIETPPTKE